MDFSSTSSDSAEIVDVICNKIINEKCKEDENVADGKMRRGEEREDAYPFTYPPWEISSLSSLCHSNISICET